MLAWNNRNNVLKSHEKILMETKFHYKNKKILVPMKTVNYTSIRSNIKSDDQINIRIRKVSVGGCVGVMKILNLHR